MKYIISILLSFSFVSLSSAGQLIRVMDKDIKGKGVECEIKIKRKDGKIELVSYTNTDGYTQVYFKCIELEKAIFVPKGDYFSTEERCPIKKKVIYLSSIRYQQTLVTNGEYLFALGDYGSAAFALSEGAARLKRYNKAESAAVGLKAFEAAGKVFGVGNATVFDPNQSKTVISPELGMAIKKHQKEVGLKETGKLDFETLKSVSKKDLPSIMFGLIEQKI